MALDKHAGRHIPVSCNNYTGRWTFPYEMFDFGVAELPHREAQTTLIREKLIDARKRGKAQIFTYVSTDICETRRVIATCYANGGHLIVPWDVYLKYTPEGSDRYFGKPEEYSDLYGFVRQYGFVRWALVSQGALKTRNVQGGNIRDMVKHTKKI